MLSFLRKTLSSAYFCVRPQQRWLTKQYRRTWMDKDEIIFTTLFGCIVHYVEVEAADQRNISYDGDLAAGHVTQEYVQGRKKIEDKITEIYLWHTHDRNLLELECDKLLDETVECLLSDNLKSVTSKNYKKVRKLKDRIQKKDQMYMKDIVTLSGYLWT
jgi:hypothetical protein